MANQSKNNPTDNKDSISIDFGQIWNNNKRYWWLFLLSLLLCGSLAVMYLRVKAPVYLVVSSMLVGQDDNTSKSSSAAGGSSSMLKSIFGGSGAKVDNEVIIMASEDIAGKMINELGINRTYYEKTGFLKKKDHYKTSPIEVDAPTSVFDTLSVSMKFVIDIDKDGKTDVKVKEGFFKTLATVENAELPVNVKTPYGLFVVKRTDHFQPTKSYKMTAMVTGNIPKAEAMMENMSIKVMSKKADAIYMDVLETNVERGRDILNTMMRLYNERGQREKDEQAINTGKFIDDRLELIYRNLMGSEAEIEAYKRAHHMVDAELQAKSAIGKQDLSEQSIVGLETQYRIVGMVKEFVSNPKNNHSLIPFDADTSAASASIKAYNNLIRERMRLETSAKEDNQVLQNLDNQINHMRNNVLRGVNSTMQAIKIKIDKAAGVNAKTQSEISQFPTEEREARALYRQQGIQNELYIFLLQKREENALLLASNTPKGKIVDKAYAKSEPVKPKRSIVAFVTLLMGLLIPIAILYLKRLITTKFASQDELEDIAHAPVIGEICHNRDKESLVVREGATSSIVELFRLIRNNVQFLLTGADDKVVLVTSSISGEGKSFVSANLASSFALLGKKVALVGMDIRSPQLAEMLSLQQVPGTTSYLSDSEATLGSVVQHYNGVKGLDVIVGGAIPPNPSELLLGNRTKAFFDELREVYDIIIVDSAPIAMVSDTFSLSKFSDATLFVTRSNYTKRSLIKYLNNVMSRGQLKNVALVLNDSNPRMSQGYGYGYGK